MWPTEDGYVIWQGGQANQLGTPFEQISAYVDSQVSSKADLSALELKQDKLSDNQLAGISYATDETLTYISFANGGDIQFYAPA